MEWAKITILFMKAETEALRLLKSKTNMRRRTEEFSPVNFSWTEWIESFAACVLE